MRELANKIKNPQIYQKWRKYIEKPANIVEISQISEVWGTLSGILAVRERGRDGFLCISNRI